METEEEAGNTDGDGIAETRSLVAGRVTLFRMNILFTSSYMQNNKGIPICWYVLLSRSKRTYSLELRCYTDRKFLKFAPCKPSESDTLVERWPVTRQDRFDIRHFDCHPLNFTASQPSHYEYFTQPCIFINRSFHEEIHVLENKIQRRLKQRFMHNLEFRAALQTSDPTITNLSNLE